jgi:hypothetical protein
MGRRKQLNPMDQKLATDVVANILSSNTVQNNPSILLAIKDEVLTAIKEQLESSHEQLTATTVSTILSIQYLISVLSDEEVGEIIDFSYLMIAICI